MEPIEQLLAQADKVTAAGYHLWDDFAIEVETAFLLHALVRSLKPDLVVESGTGRGVSGTFLASALQLNGKGELVTFEAHDFFAEGARKQLDGLPARVEMGYSADADLHPQLVFIDGVSDKRAGEIEFWLTHPDRPLVVIHDAHREYPFHLGEGVHIPGNDGVWIGRAKEKA